MAMDALRITAVAIMAVCAVLVLKSYRPELAMMVGLIAGIVILAYGINMVSGIADLVNNLLDSYGVDGQGVKSAGKIIGIAYIAQFGADTCRDCGESSLAGKVELTGRLMMVTAAMPLVISTVEAIGGLMQP